MLHFPNDANLPLSLPDQARRSTAEYAVLSDIPHKHMYNFTFSYNNSNCEIEEIHEK